MQISVNTLSARFPKESATRKTFPNAVNANALTELAKQTKVSALTCKMVKLQRAQGECLGTESR